MIPVNIPVIDPQPARASLPAAAYMILHQCIDYIIKISVGAFRGGIVAPVRQVWAYCSHEAANMEVPDFKPHPALAFVIGCLLAFVEIKAQGEPGFPFKTHPWLIMFSVTSVISYSFACAMEVVVYATRLDRASVFAVIVTLGKKGSLCILVVSLAFLFYLKCEPAVSRC